MKICIVSDSHDNRHLLDIAGKDAKERGAEAYLHCGDVVAPTTLKVLQKHGLPVHVVHGNNMGDPVATSQLSNDPESVVTYHGKDAGIELAGRKIFIVHYPHYARAMGATGDWDLVCCGHDHRAEIDTIPNVKQTETIFINPGTVAGVGAPPTYVMGNLAEMTFEVIPVPIDASMAYNMAHVTPHD